MSSKLQVRIKGETYTDIPKSSTNPLTVTPLVRIMASQPYLNTLNGWNKQVVLADQGKLCNQSLNISRGYFSWTDGKGLLKPADEWTICFWSYKVVGGIGYVVRFFGDTCIMNGTKEESRFGLKLDDKKKFALKSEKIATQKWYHVAFVNHNGTTSLYVNGIRTAIMEATHTIDLTDLTIGNIYFYAGLLDDFIIVRQALWTDAFAPPSTYL